MARNSPPPCAVTLARPVQAAIVRDQTAELAGILQRAASWNNHRSAAVVNPMPTPIAIESEVPVLLIVEDDGSVTEPPVRPPNDATMSDFIAWMRADAEHRDRFTGLATAAFDRAFRKAVRRG